jgi:SAM-dependent methyltransferase
MDLADTIDYYERRGRHYSTLIDSIPGLFRERAIGQFVDRLGPGATVLEVGSGPGRDADHIESLGIDVVRTDVARSFVEIQAERGKSVGLLNVVTDDFGGPYAGVLALCVLMHVGRGDVDDVLRKVAGALEPGGVFLVSMREGEGVAPPPAAMLFWSREGFAERLEAAGLAIEWYKREVDCDGDAWLTYVARRAA